jgi:hypothetical protein
MMENPFCSNSDEIADVVIGLDRVSDVTDYLPILVREVKGNGAVLEFNEPAGSGARPLVRRCRQWAVSEMTGPGWLGCCG